MEPTLLGLEEPVASESIVPTETRQRTLNIREVANGFVLRLEVSNPEGVNCTATGRYVTQEMVVMNLPQLLKKVRTFFEPMI